MDFSDNEYTLKQKMVRNAYTLYDSSGDEVFSSKQKLMKMKEKFPFKDPDGNEVFRVEAQNVMDIAGDYALIDSETEETFAVLKKEFTFLTESWKIEDTDGNKIAQITSRSKIFGIARTISDIANFLPHKYTIEDAEGKQVGKIKGKFSIKDTYNISLDENLENKDPILAASVTIDALEGN
jgi:Uncharacterized conserved protein